MCVKHFCLIALLFFYAGCLVFGFEDFEDYSHDVKEQRSRRPTLMEMALQISAREGLDAMFKLYASTEPQILKNAQILSENHPGALLSKFNRPEVDTQRTEMLAFAIVSAAKAFRKHYKQINDLARQARPQKISLKRTALEALCPPRDSPNCVPASERYRTHDGTCNNKRRPRWGAAQMPFNRFLPPDYGDGVDSTRTAFDGTPLPSARFVSLLVHGARADEASITLMTAQWGQLLDHDMTATAQPRPINGSVPSCCGSNDFHPSCFPIKVPLDDPWLSPLKVQCLEFLRSAPAQRRDCVLSWREQTNQATSFIDASPIYSNNVKTSDNTRSLRNGTLIFGRGNPSQDVCHRGALATQCIRAGDGRSGEQPGLLALHQVWVGEHNHIAQELANMNLHWSDEKIYQQTRRIIGALIQHITYREFLPIVLGREVCKLFDLELMKVGYYEGYDPKVNPTVANSFAAAAFRFGHSLIQDTYMRCDRHHNIISTNVSLHEEFQRGDIGSAGSLHRLLRGLATQRALKRDEFISPELTNHLFQTPGFPFGLDLAAINIQRGRDHGIPAYTAWRVPCGLSPIQNWEDFIKVVGPHSAKRIGNAYRNVHDVDLFVGGIAERPVVGGLVGPTFACIIAQQFSNSRKGDRFWYENGRMESSFTPAQLQSIRQVLFSQVLCRAVGGGTFQSHIFIPADVPGNERLQCGQGLLAPIDLRPWKEHDPFIDAENEKQTNITNDPDRKFDIFESSKQTSQNQNFKEKFKTSSPVNSLASIVTHSPQNDLLSNTVPGFQLFKNITKVNDKLDLKRKQTNLNRPKPTLGIHNKIDKGNGGSLGFKRHRNSNKQSHKRRVIINNVAVEQRNIPTEDLDYEIKMTETNNGLRLLEQLNNIPDDGNLQTNVTLFNDAVFSNFADLNPMRHSSPKQLKRVQRRDSKSNSDSISTILLTTHNDTLAERRSNGLRKNNQTRTTSFVNEPKLKEYGTATHVLKPQKVILSGQHSDDEFEIEINIRKTKKTSATRPTDYSTSFQALYPNDRYSPQYDQQNTATSPYYGHSSPQYTKRTKPPTIIYLNEAEDSSLTTKRPGLLHNLMSYTKPHPSNQKTRPQYEPIVSGGALAISPAYSSSTASSPYISKPQQSLAHTQFPNAASVFSQISSHPNSGSQISSSAISTGSFGSITGTASSNHEDTSFSFNIRPKPVQINTEAHYSNGYNQLPRPIMHNAFTNNLPFSTPSSTAQNSFNQWSNQSPFSSASKAPQKEYYNRIQNYHRGDYIDRDGSTYSQEDNTDYDYIGKNLEMINENDTSIEEEDYNEYLNENKTRSFDDEFTFKPEFMTVFLLQKKEIDITNKTILDDNYVGTLLNASENAGDYVRFSTERTDSTTELGVSSTDFLNSIPKHLNTEILAEDDNETFNIKTDATETVTMPIIAKVPFAPIRVLTKPERPDSWVFVNATKETIPLPEVPDTWSESETSVEVPTPFKNMTSIWLTRLSTEETDENCIFSQNLTTLTEPDEKLIQGLLLKMTNRTERTAKLKLKEEHHKNSST